MSNFRHAALASTPCRWLLPGALRLIAALAFCFLAGCAKPVLVITVGGLGFSQMGTVREAIQKQCPNCDVKSGGIWDAFKNDIPKIIQENPHDHVVLVGHSLGCQTIATTAGKVSNVDLLVFIEPAGDDIRVPRNVKRSLWYQRTNWDFFVGQAKVSGLSPTRINGGHNEIAHSEQLVEGVVKAINRIDVKRKK